VRYQSVKMPSNTQKDDFKTTPNRLKEQLSLTLVGRWGCFSGQNCLLTNSLFGCIYLGLNDLYHLGRLAQLARALARQAGPGIFTVHIFFNFNNLQVQFLSNFIISTKRQQEVDNRSSRRHIGVLL